MTDSVISDGTGRALTPARAQPVAGSLPPARTLLDIFAATVARCPERPALEAPDLNLTYAELADRSLSLGERLRAQGVGPGDRVGVRLASGTAELYLAVLGVLQSGAAYVPVDADDPEERAQTIWEQAGVCAVVHPGLEVALIRDPLRSRRLVTADDDAWVIFTSGSTGLPKGVAITHRSAAAFIDAEALLFSVSPEDRVLAGLSIAFDASCEEIWLAWRSGAVLVPAPRELVRSGPDLGPWLSENRVTVVSTVPTIAASWDEAHLAEVRLLILGGEAFPEALAWRLAAGREVWNTYGPTEATVVSTATAVRAGEPVTIGWPLRGWDVAIVDHRRTPVPLGEPGELVISGVGLGRYVDPQLDAERYAPLPALGWQRAYRTGDIVRERIDGIEFLGRRDDQVKIGGRRIELGEVEAQLRSAPGVKAAAAAVQTAPAGNPVLVGYVVGNIDSAEVRKHVTDRLPHGIVPLIVALDRLPMTGAGKLDRKALPWPPPTSSTAQARTSLSGTARWLAELWAEQLGPRPFAADSDFFELGGSSLAAAKLVSVLRARYPSVAVADVYEHRRLGELAARLDHLGQGAEAEPSASPSPRPRGWTLWQLTAVLLLRVLATPPWLIGVLAVNRIEGLAMVPRVGWGWLIGGWILFGSAPGRSLLLVLTRRLVLRDLRPGRFPRHSGLMLRLWLVERLADTWRLGGLEGTPWAARYARLLGHRVGAGARLFTLPPAASLIEIGAGAVIEPQVDIEGWWIDGDALVVGELVVAEGARLGNHSVLMPGARIGAFADVEPGSVVNGTVGAGEVWAGSPARRVGEAAANWPSAPAPAPQARALWRVLYVAGIAIRSLLPLAAAVPGLLLLTVLTGPGDSAQQLGGELLLTAPLMVASFLVTYGLLIAVLMRSVSPLLRPGWHPEGGSVRWALWFTEALMGSANEVLFAFYLSVYTRLWLRLVGIKVGRRAEVSVAYGLNRLTCLGEKSFAADAVVFAHARSRGGWLHVGTIEIGERSFLGNGAIVSGDTEVGADCLVGVLSSTPARTDAGTSWLGCPPFELPRTGEEADPTRTTDPPRRLVAARGATELVRILLPGSVSLGLASLAFQLLESVGAHHGLAAMIVLTPPVFLLGGICAVALTIALKWILMGRYRPGRHPLWSFFVWRDEIMNSCQEQLAAAWLMRSAEATPVMSLYLRAMGARVGRDVWCETMTITEFDMVSLDDGAIVNRHGIVQSHLFHDRLLQIGPVSLGRGSTLGPISAVLPESVLGDGSTVGARSVVMRGEHLPAHTRWHGVPVVAV